MPKKAQVENAMTLNVDELERRIEHEMRQHTVPGFALAIVQGKEVVYARGFGVTSVEDAGLPVTPHTLFCSGSISKPLTGVTVMRLVEHGALDLDVPVTEYLPWLASNLPDLAGAITLRRLLSHTSGLFGTGGNVGPRDLTGLEAFIREAVPLAPFVAPPGTVFEYCNLGIDLAGLIVEIVTGKYFPEVVQEQVLRPLHMERTTYDRTVAMTYPVALPHLTGPDDTVRVQHRMFDSAAANPSGQVMASTLDLANLAIMLLNNGEFGNERVLSPSSVREMLRPRARLYDPADSGYGLTFWVLKHSGLTWVTHAGLLTPYLCELSLIPDRGIGVVFQCNITNDFNPYAVRRSMIDDLLGFPAQPRTSASLPIAPLETDPSGYTGTYLSLAAGLATLGLADNGLTLEREGEVLTLRAVREHLFVSESGEASVGFVPGEGRIEYFMLDEHAYRRFEGDPYRTAYAEVAVCDSWAKRSRDSAEGACVRGRGENVRITPREARTVTAYVEWDPQTKLYVGIVPGIPGAHTQAATLDELRQNLKEVVELCVEEHGVEMPHFVGIQQIEIEV